MAEPQHEWSTILATMAGSALSAIFSVMAWWRGFKKEIHERIDGVESVAESNMKSIESLSNEHSTRIAVLETHQENNVGRLDMLQESVRDANQKLDDLGHTLTEVLLAVKHGRS